MNFKKYSLLNKWTLPKTIPVQHEKGLKLNKPLKRGWNIFMYENHSRMELRSFTFKSITGFFIHQFYSTNSLCFFALQLQKI